jgi:hypothetical protein
MLAQLSISKYYNAMGVGPAEHTWPLHEWLGAEQAKCIFLNNSPSHAS